MTQPPEPSAGAGAREPAERRPTACILCECNCGIEVVLDGRRLASIRGDARHPSSAGYTCEKALRLDHYQNGRHRLTTPLRRRPDGTHEEIDWDTAVREVAARLQAVREEHGGERIFFYGGGGQGNHLGGVHGRALQAALGVRYASNALAQEKTGEMWVDAKLYGGHTKGDVEHAEVALFLGKNPWQSHSFPRARPVLREIARDPARTLVVVDPRRSETAAMADVHLQVRPGTDAWCLAALLGTVVQEGLVDEAFVRDHTSGAADVRAALQAVDVAACAAACDVDEELLRSTARRVATARSAVTYEDLGVQQSPHSTLVSYLNKLLWVLTGNFGRPGTMYLHSSFAAVAGAAATGGGRRPARTTPVTGARIISGLVPCTAIPDEVLSDSPERLRAMWVDSSNPAHSLPDSARFRQALEALDLVVVVDVALTETARLADYVLPAASQYEKWECTFFNVEFPHNTFQLRPPLMDPLPGTLPEPEIYGRVLRELDVLPQETVEALAQAARTDRGTFTAAFLEAVTADPSLLALAPHLLHETLGPALPEGQRGTAAVWGLAQLCALAHPAAVRRAGHADGDALFDAVVATPSGVVFTADAWEDVWDHVRRPDRRFTIAVPELLADLEAVLGSAPGWVDEDYPFVLSAGERRAFTANTIIRDPAWRRRDPVGALRLCPSDAARLGLADGDLARVTTRWGSGEVPVEVTDTMRPGHVSLPNGLGTDHPDAGRTGLAVNELTGNVLRDPVAGTPWHKHVPARVEAVAGAAEPVAAAGVVAGAGTGRSGSLEG